MKYSKKFKLECVMKYKNREYINVFSTSFCILISCFVNAL